jgi:hypothetical protein
MASKTQSTAASAAALGLPTSALTPTQPSAPQGPVQGTPTPLPITPSAATGATADPMLVGITEAMIAAHPELAQVRNLYVSGNYAAALNALYDTDFYKNTGSVAFTNEEMRVNQPGVYTTTLNEQWLPTLRNYATQQGLKVSDATLNTIAQKAMAFGLTPNSAGTLELFRGTDSTGQPYITGIVGGQAATTRNNIATANADYGVAYNQDWINKAAASVADGATTEQYWTDQIKNLAKSKYAAWGSQIDAGLTVKQIAQPYIQTMATKLGVDSASITLDDKLLNQGLQGTDPTKPAGIPLWNFEKMVMQDPRWAVSKDAMDTLSAAGTNMLKSWGLMS